MTTTAENLASFNIDSKNNILILSGAWTIKGIAKLHDLTLSFSSPHHYLIVNGSGIEKMDSAGAWQLYSLLNKLREQGQKIQLENFDFKHAELLKLIADKEENMKQINLQHKTPNFFYLVGKVTLEKYQQFLDFIDFIGEVVLTAWHALIHPRILQIKGILQTIEETGYQALPIIALLSFLIGVVLAYQMGLQLKIYGANIFIVQVSGMAVLREFAPLITAIIMAGRTTSAFTAQLGTMKINEEIDALRTMGILPINHLVLPKLSGTIIATPLLTVWSMLFGMLGSMAMSKIMLGIDFYSFISHFRSDVGLSNYVVGLVKTPVFAGIIAGVGCFRGFQVQSNADSIGQQTTRSVVQAIFLIIVADAIFSVIFSWKGV